ncbi:helix-turn-helix domain-containing protein [Microbacterium sp. gxy059]|uniref:helix-turn-helix domain-containing protein n=1 Tax=Microbacterium sp. gxy059 TaxID=2957199 RepID=UPI003D952704
MTRQPREWITIAEAAEIARRSPRTIYEWAQHERLASRVENGRVLVLRKAVERIAPTVKRGRPPRTKNTQM